MTRNNRHKLGKVLRPKLSGETSFLGVSYFYLDVASFQWGHNWEVFIMIFMTDCAITNLDETEIPYGSYLTSRKAMSLVYGPINELKE